MQSLGERLRSAREAKGATASEAAAATKIKVQHIEALEAEDFGKIAAPIYVKGFLKLYAEYLGFEPNEIIEHYKSDNAPLSPSDIVGDGESQRKNTAGFKFLSPSGNEKTADSAAGEKTDVKAFPAILKAQIERLRDALRRIDLPPGLVKHGATLLGAIIVLVLLISMISNCARRNSGKIAREKQDDISLIEGIPEPYIEPEDMPRN